MLKNGQTGIEKAIDVVYTYVKERLVTADMHPTFSIDEVYCVWFTKTLQNWKAIVGTTLPGGNYYEVTYNGDKNETYIDVYKKYANICIPDARPTSIALGTTQVLQAIDSGTQDPASLKWHGFHSRACPIYQHPHGPQCSSNCPTCQKNAV